jgi:phosphate transport system permease protein
VGSSPQLTLDPRESVQTMTAFIVSVSLGDTPAESIQFKALFAVGAVLFTVTFLLNLLSERVVRRFRTIY